MQQVQNNVASGAVFGSQDDGDTTSYAWSIYSAAGTYFGWLFYKTLSQAVEQASVPNNTRFDVLRVEVSGGQLKVNGAQVRLPVVSGAFTAERPCWIFARNSYTTPIKFNGRIFSFDISGAANMKLIPALRNSDGVPGMLDTVSKQFFTNSGTGTFGYRVKTTGQVVAPSATTYSLRAPRDPYYVAPSQVWARLNSEGQLDIVAETDLQDGEEAGYSLFANTGEAYAHFGITEQEPV